MNVPDLRQTTKHILEFRSTTEALEYAKAHPPVKLMERGPDGEMRPSPYQPNIASERSTHDNGHCPWPEFYRRMQSPGAHFSDEICNVLEAASEILGELPTKNAKSRKRVAARRGASFSTASILAGSFSTAFSKWDQVWTKKPPTHVAIFLPATFSCHISPKQIAMSTGTALALGIFLETEFGVNVDLWSIEYSHSPFRGKLGEHLGIIVQLKPSQCMIDLETVAPVAHPGWLRSLHFRLCEGIAVPNGNYGHVPPPEDYQAYILDFAERWGFIGPRIIASGGHRGVLSTKTEALKWVEAQFRLLELID